MNKVAPYTDIANQIWQRYLRVLRLNGVLSEEAICLAGVLHTLGRAGWVMPHQGYTYGSNKNDFAKVRNRAKAYPDQNLSDRMVTALDDAECGHCFKDYDGRKWNWPQDHARPRLVWSGAAITISGFCETDLAIVNRAALYDHVELKIYDQPQSKGREPTARYTTDEGSFTLTVSDKTNTANTCYVKFGLVGPGAASWDNATLEWGTPTTNISGPQTADHDLFAKLNDIIVAAQLTQPASNTEHHARWDTVATLIGRNKLPEAYDYAQPWAAKNWQPWVKIRSLLKPYAK